MVSRVQKHSYTQKTFKYMDNKYNVDNVAMLKTIPFKSKVIVNCCFEQSP